MIAALDHGQRTTDNGPRTEHRFAVQFSGRVDRQKGIIHGVSVIKKGTVTRATGPLEIDDKTLAQLEECARQYSGGLKVVASHTKPADSPFAAAGFLRNFHREGEHLRADLHVMKSEPNREKLLEMAEEIADTFGLSVSFAGVDDVIGNRTFARCSEIYNCALVDMPAANPTGLFAAHVDASAGENLTPQMTPDEIKALVTAHINTALVEFGGRIKAVEDGAKALAASDAVKSLETKLTELSAKLDTDRKEFAATVAKDRAEAIKGVAQEFASVLGKSAVRADGGGNGGGGGEDPNKAALDAFDATLTKHFSATSSKTRTWQLAQLEDPKGYAAFIQAQRKPAFESKK